MPIFEYTCNACARNFSALVGVVAGSTPPQCPRCQSVDLKKRVSRFARLRSEEETIDRLAERADSLDPDDAGEMRRFMKEMAGEMGEDFSDADLDEMMDDVDSPEMGAGGGGAAEDNL